MKFYTKLLTVLMVPIFFMACGDDDGPTIMDSEQANTKAMQIVSGQIQSTQLDTTGVKSEWDVDVITDVGSIIEIEFDQATGVLLEIDGDEAPFTYEVNPGMGLILFSKAKGIAIDGATSVEIDNWKLDQDFQGKWIYEFNLIKDQVQTSLKIDAATGTVLA